MTFKSTRLGLGEQLLGIGCVLLVVDLFAVPWFAYQPQYRATAVMLDLSVSASGWQTFEVIGPLALFVCVVGLAICVLTAARRSPAVPVVLTTLLLPISFVLAVLVAIRVLLDRPAVHLAQAGGANVIQPRAGAYVGLALTLVIFAGLYLSLRREGVASEDSPATIETVRV
jgi:hypothetical protein